MKHFWKGLLSLFMACGTFVFTVFFGAFTLTDRDFEWFCVAGVTIAVVAWPCYWRALER